MVERRGGSKHIHHTYPRGGPTHASGKVRKRVWRMWREVAIFQAFAAEGLPWNPFEVIVYLDRLSLDWAWWLTGVTAFRLMSQVLASWRGGPIARNGVTIPVLLFVIFEEVRVDVPDIYDFYVWWDVSELE